MGDTAETPLEAVRSSDSSSDASGTTSAEGPPEPSPHERSASRQRALEVAQEVLETEARALASLSERFDADAFDRALDLLLGCRGRVVCAGMGKSGIIAKKLAGTLASTGSPAFFLHPADAGHGDLGMVVEGDVVIALSHSGETRELLNLLPAVKRLGLPLIALVGEPESTLAREADVVLRADIEAEACPLGLAPTASTTAALAVGDALAMASLEERGFSVDDFVATHPRGTLARELLRVKDVMHTAPEVPRVRADATLAAVVAEMSEKGFGMTSVVDDEGRLQGIITDGDLRRLLERTGGTPEATVAADAMTGDPVCVEKSALATEALRLMESGRITSLLVVDGERRPEAVVHLHDLWRTEMI